jgi:hypothetical protein
MNVLRGRLENESFTFPSFQRTSRDGFDADCKHRHFFLFEWFVLTFDGLTTRAQANFMFRRCPIPESLIHKGHCRGPQPLVRVENNIDGIEWDCERRPTDRRPR